MINETIQIRLIQWAKGSKLSNRLVVVALSCRCSKLKIEYRALIDLLYLFYWQRNKLPWTQERLSVGVSISVSQMVNDSPCFQVSLDVETICSRSNWSVRGTVVVPRL